MYGWSSKARLAGSTVIEKTALRKYFERARTEIEKIALEPGRHRIHLIDLDIGGSSGERRLGWTYGDRLTNRASRAKGKGRRRERERRSAVRREAREEEDGRTDG